MWEQQNHDLESERLRLLRAPHASQMSTDKGRAQFGLDHDQLLQLMHFAEQLRDGKLPAEITVPDDKSRTLQMEKEKLQEDLNIMKAKVDLLQEQNRIHGRTPSDSESEDIDTGDPFGLGGGDMEAPGHGHASEQPSRGGRRGGRRRARGGKRACLSDSSSE